MCLLASEESLFCAANTTFGPQKTADILNYPQRESTTQKRNNAYLDLLEEKKDPRSTSFLIARSPSATSVIACVLGKRFSSVWEQTTRNESQRPREEMERVKERDRRGDQQKSGPLWPLWGCERTRRTPLPYGPGPIVINSVGTKISNKNNWTNCEVETYYSHLYSSSETRGQLVGKIECSW